MVTKFILKSVLKAFKERELFADLMGLMEDVVGRSERLGGVIGAINGGVDVVNEKFDSMGMKGMLIKQLVRSFVEDLAKDNERIAAALGKGLPYIKAVYDGLDKDEIVGALKPIIARVAEDAATKVNSAVDGEFYRADDGNLISGLKE